MRVGVENPLGGGAQGDDGAGGPWRSRHLDDAALVTVVILQADDVGLDVDLGERVELVLGKGLGRGVRDLHCLEAVREGLVFRVLEA